LIAHELTHVVQQSGVAPVVRRAVSYPAATVTTEDPIRRALTAPHTDLALTEPTVNGNRFPPNMDAAIKLIKDAFQPTAVALKGAPAPTGGQSPGSGSGSASSSAGPAKAAEGSGSGSRSPSPAAGSGAGSGSGSATPKTAEGSGSGSGAGTTAECSFRDFDVKIGALVRLPVAPSRGQWGPINVAASDLGGSPPPICEGKTQIEAVMTGKPATDAFYNRIKANEQEHVDDLKLASDQYLVPYYRDITALTGRGGDPTACEANLRTQLGRLADDKIRSFLTKVLADVRARDVPGGHPNRAATRVSPDCSRISITAEPVPPPPRPTP
jgi:hypothetical protein